MPRDFEGPGTVESCATARRPIVSWSGVTISRHARERGIQVLAPPEFLRIRDRDLDSRRMNPVERRVREFPNPNDRSHDARKVLGTLFLGRKAPCLPVDRQEHHAAGLALMLPNQPDRRGACRLSRVAGPG